MLAFSSCSRLRICYHSPTCTLNFFLIPIIPIQLARSYSIFNISLSLPLSLAFSFFFLLCHSLVSSILYSRVTKLLHHPTGALHQQRKQKQEPTSISREQFSLVLLACLYSLLLLSRHWSTDPSYASYAMPLVSTLHFHPLSLLRMAVQLPFYSFSSFPHCRIKGRVVERASTKHERIHTSELLAPL